MEFQFCDSLHRNKFNISTLQTKTNPNVEYFSGMLLGTAITAVNVLLFTLFVYLYFSTLTTDQLVLLQGNILFMGGTISPLKIAGATFVEGFSSGVVISFIIMQYYKSGFRKVKANKSIES